MYTSLIEDVAVAQSCTWGGQPLPPCAYRTEAVLLTNEKSRRKNDKDAAAIIDVLAAYAGKFALWANVTLWMFYIFFPMCALFEAQCDHKGGFATASTLLLVLYLPFLIVSLRLEACAHARILPAHLHFLGPYKIFGVEVPFAAYTTVAVGVSTLSHLDLATTGITTARLLKTSWCEDSKVENIWNQVLDASLTPWLPSLWMLGVIGWGMLLMQFVIALLYGLPLRSGRTGNGGQAVSFTTFMQLDIADIQRVYLNPPDSGNFHDIIHPKNFQFKPFLGTSCFGSDVLEVFAESARMNWLSFRTFSYNALALGPLLKDHGVLRLTWVMRMSKSANRTMAYLLLEACYQINVQTTLLGVVKASSGGTDLDTFTSVSCLMSIIMAVYNIITGVSKMREMLALARPHVEASCDTAHMPDEWKSAYLQRIIFWAMLRFTFAITACTIGILYGAAKLVAAYVCPSGVWNVTGCPSITA